MSNAALVVSDQMDNNHVDFCAKYGNSETHWRGRVAEVLHCASILRVSYSFRNVLQRFCLFIGFSCKLNDRMILIAGHKSECHPGTSVRVSAFPSRRWSHRGGRNHCITLWEEIWDNSAVRWEEMLRVQQVILAFWVSEKRRNLVLILKQSVFGMLSSNKQPYQVPALVAKIISTVSLSLCQIEILYKSQSSSYSWFACSGSLCCSTSKW